jgi:hypothetical protein
VFLVFQIFGFFISANSGWLIDRREKNGGSSWTDPGGRDRGAPAVQLHANSCPQPNQGIGANIFHILLPVVGDLNPDLFLSQHYSLAFIMLDSQLFILDMTTQNDAGFDLSKHNTHLSR